MFEGYRVYDADAHVIMSPRLWESLPEPYAARRPRPMQIADNGDMGFWNSGWLIEGRMEPHPWGPGSQGANTPGWVLGSFGADRAREGSFDLSAPQARLGDMDQMGIDIQVLFPSSLYACMTGDPGFEAALFRAYNRYLAAQCKASPGRLRWAGLLPLRDARQGIEAMEEMVRLGASAAVVFGTVGERLLSHPSFTPIWDAFRRAGLPLCVHMGRSYPPFDQLVESRLEAHVIAMGMPAQLAFVALVGQGMLDRYPDLKVGFFEFGAEWLFYVVGRMGHYMPSYRRDVTVKALGKVPEKDIEDYMKAGRIFLAGEADDPLLVQEIALVGEDHILFSSDFPHGEGREEAARELLDRADLTRAQKQKVLHDNAARFFGLP